LTFIQNITLHQIFDWAGAVVLVSSLLGTFLPPYEWFDRWPNFQAVYKIIKMIIAKWGAISLQSLVYPSMTVPQQAQTKMDAGVSPGIPVKEVPKGETNEPKS
jgi:hypothetical protein